MKLVDNAGTRGNMWMVKSMNFRQTVMAILETCIGTPKKLRRVMNSYSNGETVSVPKDSHSIWNRWRNHFSQFMKVRGVNDYYAE